MYKNITIIAEVKTVSPFGFKSEKTWIELFDIAKQVGDIISVHTDPRWGGSFENIINAKKLTNKPILAKGIHKTDKEISKAVEYGADYVLVVGRVPKVFGELCFIEPFGLEQLKIIPEGSRVVWNSRDLASGKKKPDELEKVRDIWKGWLCQASNISTIKDINDGVNAVLVGTHLQEFANSLQEK